MNLISVGAALELETKALKRVWLHPADVDTWIDQMGQPNKERGKEVRSKPITLNAVTVALSKGVPRGCILKVYRSDWIGEKYGTIIPGEPSWRLCVEQ